MVLHWQLTASEDLTMKDIFIMFQHPRIEFFVTLLTQLTASYRLDMKDIHNLLIYNLLTNVQHPRPFIVYTR